MAEAVYLLGIEPPMVRRVDNPILLDSGLDLIVIAIVLGILTVAIIVADIWTHYL